jgi:hypothetical protein
LGAPRRRLRNDLGTRRRRLRSNSGTRRRRLRNEQRPGQQYNSGPHNRYQTS